MEKEKKPTQKQMVLEHLKKYGSLDPMTALMEYGIMNGLHSRITELRREGYDIETSQLKGVSKITGRTWKVAKYVYHSNEPAIL